MASTRHVPFRLLKAGRHALRTRQYSSARVSDDCDIVIVGGGPAGLALASALGSSAASNRLRIVLVEGGDLSKVHGWSLDSDVYSNRVSSLTNASQSFLRDIGAWSHVEESRTCPMEDMEVWDGVSDARISFHASDVPTTGSTEGQQMARLTENLNLQRGLLRHLKTHPEIELIDKTKVESIIRDEEEGQWPLVKLANDRILRTRLLIGADGFNSPVRSYARIPSYGWSYNTQAIVATMFHSPPSLYQNSLHTTAYQRFLPTGPIAFLPLSPTASSLVWSINPPELAQALVASASQNPSVLASMINAAFRLPTVSLKYLYDVVMDARTKGVAIDGEAITKEIRWREESHGIDGNSTYASSSTQLSQGMPSLDAASLPPLVTSIQPGTVASFPLKYNHAETYLGEGLGARTVLVGDAAHTVHPLAGQGLNQGLADVECLSKCIAEAVANGGDVGSYTALLPYAQERYIANHTIMSAVDKLHKLYSTEFEPVVWARSVGLEVLNELDVVKSAIMATAGAHSSKTTNSADAAAGINNGWSVVAKGFESYASTVKAARMASQGAVGLIGGGLEGIGRIITNLSK
ncbi:putative ubiquinone biosynthesis monooxygenase [Pleurotus ostreatus]|uniref:Ubiquinone biosynthesis monooxygenase COQ6, mitochondrial n=1 Tax=Pleurotus ostreatus TaxID=5322 RepID=A0A8H6ZTT5_PLEOS|nr:putative ubiquinone biosynthesis monooxygenase [Pleurotus ostreatus]KAF7430776.1 putative ubiquinone biosynthesis monooxygenase [Pleurotus ostreatus]KAJ8695126.1 putative ubiquinone biosynthesis monooxygenase [Pleurotus ostreatus]